MDQYVFGQQRILKYSCSVDQFLLLIALKNALPIALAVSFFSVQLFNFFDKTLPSYSSI